MRWIGLLVIAATSMAATAACEESETGSGGSDGGPAGSGSPSGTPAAQSASSGFGSGATSAATSGATGSASGSGSASASSGQGGGGGAPNNGLDTLGSLVVLGDSISDGGGQSPYYYNLLRDMLETKYGGLAYHREAQSGSKTGALLGQIDDLPNQLPGPVAVAITSGGNDMKDALPLIIAGADAAARTTMGNNIDAALAELTSPGRFGSGVEVYVFETTIYDASAGQGDFGQHDCAFGDGVPAIPTDGFFANWNGEIAGSVAAHSQTLVDMHAAFYDHGYAGSPNWFASDCTHPNALGHAALADLFYVAITGEAPP